MMRRFFLIVAASGLILTAACNTVKGLGKDIESVGQTGDEAINK